MERSRLLVTDPALQALRQATVSLIMTLGKNMKEDQIAFDSLILNWDDFYWLGHIQNIGMLGREVAVHIDTKDEEKMAPHPSQIDVWKRIVSKDAHYAEIIRNGLFQYYCRIRPQYERAGPEWIANMPIITRKEEIDEFLNLNYIQVFWPYDSKEPKIGFSYACTWDREHGAGIVIKGDEIVDAGSADCLFST